MVVCALVVSCSVFKFLNMGPRGDHGTSREKLFQTPFSYVNQGSPLRTEIIDARMTSTPIANPHRNSTHQCGMPKIRTLLRQSPDQMPAKRVIHTQQPTDAQTIEEILFQCPSTEKSQGTAWDGGCSTREQVANKIQFLVLAAT